MKTLNAHPLLRTRGHDDLRSFLGLGLISERVFLAGGALRTLINGEQPADYDVFFREGEGWRENVEACKAKLRDAGYTLLFACPEGFMFTFVLREEPEEDGQPGRIIRKVQLICEVAYQDLSHLISTFDLAPCCAGTDGTHLVLYRDFVKSTMFNRLHLRSLSYPVATMGRIFKYIKKGYDKAEVFKEFCAAIDAGSPWPENAWRKYID